MQSVLKSDSGFCSGLSLYLLVNTHALLLEPRTGSLHRLTPPSTRSLRTETGACRIHLQIASAALPKGTSCCQTALLVLEDYHHPRLVPIWQPLVFNKRNKEIQFLQRERIEIPNVGSWWMLVCVDVSLRQLGVFLCVYL